MSCGKILSIQSHVVHGYVGNRAAVFPLQVKMLDLKKYPRYAKITKIYAYIFDF